MLPGQTANPQRCAHRTANPSAGFARCPRAIHDPLRGGLGIDARKAHDAWSMLQTLRTRGKSAYLKLSAKPAPAQVAHWVNSTGVAARLGGAFFEGDFAGAEAFDAAAVGAEEQAAFFVDAGSGAGDPVSALQGGDAFTTQDVVAVP